jgi:hypothetical protein
MNRSFQPAAVDQVLGLLRVVHSLGGKTDIYRIDEEVEIDFDEISLAVGAAESLGLVAVKAGDVELTELGRRAVLDLDSVKAEIARRLASLTPFADILASLRRKTPLPLGEVTEMLCWLGYCGDVPTRRVIAWAVLFGLIEITSDDLVFPGALARS